MKNKRLFKVGLGIALAMVFGLFLLGCNTTSSDDSLVNVRVINNTGRAISDVRFNRPDGTFITVEEVVSRQAWGNGGRGQCWMRQDSTYTLSWWCYENGGRQYAQRGGYCGGWNNNNLQSFQFNGGGETIIEIRSNNTWRFVGS